MSTENDIICKDNESPDEAVEGAGLTQDTDGAQAVNHNNEVCEGPQAVDGADPSEHVEPVVPIPRDSGGSSSSTPPTEVLHKVKKIKFHNNEVPIITQNNNGPCPLLAILNALVLQGKVDLDTPGVDVKGGYLVSVVANALIDQLPSVGNVNTNNQHMLPHIHYNTQDAVQQLDKLLTGLDVNVKFSGVQDFESTSELTVFDCLRVNLYHGWVVDPEWPVAQVVQDLSYNQLTNNILAWKHEASEQNDDLLLTKAVLAEEFLSSTSMQLTVHGLFTLGSTMKEGEVAVLFRNNHFSTILKQNDQLFQLLTDQGFLNQAAVWETLSDVDSSYTEFVTDNFEPFQPRSENEPRGASPSFPMTREQQVTNDEELAAVLQQEDTQQMQNEESFALILERLGCDDNTTDEEIARRLQEEEQRAVEADQYRRESYERGRGRGGALGGARGGGAPPHRPHLLDRENKKKKDNCCIL